MKTLKISGRGKYAATLLLPVLIASGCRKEPAPRPPYHSAPVNTGEIVINARDTASIDSIFALFNRLPEVMPERMSGFVYSSSLPPDSLDVVTSTLRARFYIDTSSPIAISSVTNTVQVNCAFLAMNIAQQQDFLALKQRFNFVDSREQVKIIYAKVIPGQEQFWAAKMKTYSIVENADPIVIVY